MTRDRFADAARAPLDAGRLAEAAMCIAAEADPELDIDAELRTLHALAAGCPGDVAGLRRYLCEELGFTGDARTYGHPRNSYLHLVMRRRRGIPITLSVLAMEVGRIAGVPILGIATPGHFLARAADDPDVYLDVFHGRLLDEDGVRALLGVPHLDRQWLAPVEPPTILRRMLNNLRPYFARRLQHHDLLWTLDLELLLPGAGDEVRGARAACLERLCRFDESAAIHVQLGDDAAARSALAQRN